MKRTKRAGLLTKLVFAVLLIFLCISLLNQRSTLVSAESARDGLQTRVDELTEHNVALQSDIDHSDDPDVMLEVAKERLGLVASDEVVFYDTSN